MGSLELDSGLMIRQFPVTRSLGIVAIIIWRGGEGANYRVVGTRIIGRVGIPYWLPTAGLLLGFILQYVSTVNPYRTNVENRVSS